MNAARAFRIWSAKRAGAPDLWTRAASGDDLARAWVGAWLASSGLRLDGLPVAANLPTRHGGRPHKTSSELDRALATLLDYALEPHQIVRARVGHVAVVEDRIEWTLPPSGSYTTPRVLCIHLGSPEAEALGCLTRHGRSAPPNAADPLLSVSMSSVTIRRAAARARAERPSVPVKIATL